MKISLLCPSRERLNKFLTFLTSVISTTHDIKNINIVLGVDEDDPKFKSYKKIANNLHFIQFIPFPKNLFKEKGLSGLWNKMANECSGDILGMVGDDMIFKTNDWDKKIIETFINKKDNMHLIHCNDGMRGPGNKYSNVEPLAVNSFIHREYVDTIGWYVEDIEPNTYHDTYLHKLFEILNRKIYYHDIVIKHLHFSEYGQKDKTAEILEKERENVWNNNQLFDTKLMPQLLKEVEILKAKYS